MNEHIYITLVQRTNLNLLYYNGECSTFAALFSDRKSISL